MPKQLTEVEINARIAPASVRWPSTAIHWEKLKDAVEAARGLVAAVDANCRAVEQDADLSPEGVARKRAEIGRRAVGEVADFAPLRAAESAVGRAVAVFESGMVDLPKPPSNAVDVSMAQEVRAYVRTQKNPTGFVLKHLDEPRVVGAVLHAPGFLSGLNDEAMNVVRERARSTLHPEHVQRRKEAEAALEELHRAIRASKGMIIARTGAQVDIGKPVTPSLTARVS
jgi:hypothetical protein